MKRKDDSSKTMQIASMGTYLRSIREGKNISLTDVAKHMGYTKGYISSIETEKRPFPHNPDFIRDYAGALEISPGELRAALSRFSISDEVKQSNIPHERNAFFTGRELEIKEMHTTLTINSNITPVCALTGISGIGKTTTAVEYAFRYSNEYQFTLWIQADTPDDLAVNLAGLASFLDLPEKSAQDRRTTIAIVKHWLQENSHCLLIFDNIDESSIDNDFFSELGRNHIILTTRTQLLGHTVHNIELKQISEDDGILLLLRQSQLFSKKTELDKIPDMLKIPASQISTTLGGLPFALNQAANYIAETQCGLSYYLKLLQTEQMKLLVDENSLASSSPIAVWSISFKKISTNNLAAAEILLLCAFLYPDTIYRELFIEGSSALPPTLRAITSDPLRLNQAIKDLLRYSLVQSDVRSGALSMHRLVQAIIRDSLSSTEQRQWVEIAIKVMNLAFPLIEVATWHKTWHTCQLYFHQARACADLIEQWMITSNESRQLLYKLGTYLGERTEFKKAEHMYQLALDLDKQAGIDSDTLITDIYTLALFYQKQGKYEKAEEYYGQVIQLFRAEEIIDNHRALFVSYIDLLKNQNKIEEAKNIQGMAGTSILEERADSKKRVVVNDNDEDIKYKGLWKYSKRRWGDYDNDAHITSEKDASFQYTFIGYGIEIISDPSTFQGEIDIYIDGEYIQTIYSALFHDRQGQISQTIIFSEVTLEQGKHTLEARLANGAFALDALAFFSE